MTSYSPPPPTGDELERLRELEQLRERDELRGPLEDVEADDASESFDLAAIADSLGLDLSGVQLEQQLGGLLSGAFQALRAGGGSSSLEALEKRTTTEDGRTVRLVVAPVEGFAKQLAPLGGIEGVTELMLISFGATTETDGDPLMADVAAALRNAEPIDLTIRTPRHAVRFSMVNAAAWSAAQALDARASAPSSAPRVSVPYNSPATTARRIDRPKAKPGGKPPRTVPASVELPPMLRPRSARGVKR
jgi:hypothetical protein